MGNQWGKVFTDGSKFRLLKVKTVHEQQKLAWETEHLHPFYLVGLNGQEPSGGVRSFWDYLSQVLKKGRMLKGLEIGCGKGRNAIWLARQGIQMAAFDFSSVAVKEAKQRSGGFEENNIHFFEHDIISRWPFLDQSFDFIIDCFASTDVEGLANQRYLAQEAYRVLKPEGYFCLYTNSINSQVYRDPALAQHASQESHLYWYPDMHKFENVFETQELDQLYNQFTLKEAKVFSRLSQLKNNQVEWEHLWRIYQKSLPYA